MMKSIPSQLVFSLLHALFVSVLHSAVGDVPVLEKHAVCSFVVDGSLGSVRITCSSPEAVSVQLSTSMTKSSVPLENVKSPSEDGFFGCDLGIQNVTAAVSLCIAPSWVVTFRDSIAQNYVGPSNDTSTSQIFISITAMDPQTTSIQIQNSSFTNVSNATALSIYSTSTTITQSNFTDNYNPLQSGAGLLLLPVPTGPHGPSPPTATINLTHCHLSDNSAKHGAAITITPQRPPGTITDEQVSAPSQTLNADVSSLLFSISLTDSHLDNNKVASFADLANSTGPLHTCKSQGQTHHGGAILLKLRGSPAATFAVPMTVHLNFTDSSMTRNSASNGGAIYVDAVNATHSSQVVFTMSNSTFANNSAVSMCAEADRVCSTSCTCQQNRQPGVRGPVNAAPVTRCSFCRGVKEGHSSSHVAFTMSNTTSPNISAPVITCREADRMCNASATCKQNGKDSALRPLPAETGKLEQECSFCRVNGTQSAFVAFTKSNETTSVNTSAVIDCAEADRRCSFTPTCQQNRETEGVCGLAPAEVDKVVKGCSFCRVNGGAVAVNMAGCTGCKSHIHATNTSFTQNLAKGFNAAGGAILIDLVNSTRSHALITGDNLQFNGNTVHGTNFADGGAVRIIAVIADSGYTQHAIEPKFTFDGTSVSFADNLCVSQCTVDGTGDICGAANPTGKADYRSGNGGAVNIDMAGSPGAAVIFKTSTLTYTRNVAAFGGAFNILIHNTSVSSFKTTTNFLTLENNTATNNGGGMHLMVGNKTTVMFRPVHFTAIGNSALGQLSTSAVESLNAGDGVLGTNNGGGAMYISMAGCKQCVVDLEAEYAHFESNSALPTPFTGLTSVEHYAARVGLQAPLSTGGCPGSAEESSERMYSIRRGMIDFQMQPRGQLVLSGNGGQGGAIHFSGAESAGITLTLFFSTKLSFLNNTSQFGGGAVYVFAPGTALQYNMYCPPWPSGSSRGNGSSSEFVGSSRMGEEAGTGQVVEQQTSQGGAESNLETATGSNAGSAESPAGSNIGSTGSDTWSTWSNIGSTGSNVGSTGGSATSKPEHFKDNKAEASAGGAMHFVLAPLIVNRTANINIIGCRFVGNSASSGSGGAIYAAGDPREFVGLCRSPDDSRLTRSSCHVDSSAATPATGNNQERRTGSPHGANHGSMFGQEGDDAFNTANATAPGPLGYSSSSLFNATARAQMNPMQRHAPVLLLSELIFEENVAFSGGAVFVHNTTGLIHQCLFDSNQAVSLGGGLAAKASFMLELSGCVFFNNSAATQGGAIYGALGDAQELNRLIFISTNIVYNNAGEEGGGIYLAGGGTTLCNCTITYNTARQRGGGISFANRCGRGLSVDHCSHLTRNASTQACNDTSGGMCGSRTLPCYLCFAPSSQLSNNSAQSGDNIFFVLPVPDTQLELFIDKPPDTLPTYRAPSMSTPMVSSSEQPTVAPGTATGGNPTSSSQQGGPRGNTASGTPTVNGTFMPGVTAPPCNGSLEIVGPETLQVASTLGPRGILPLVVQLQLVPDKGCALSAQTMAAEGTRLSVDFNDPNQPPRSLLMGNTAKSNATGRASFLQLHLARVIPGGDGKLKLKVFAPDYPQFQPKVIEVYIRSCIIGEYHNTDMCDECTGGGYAPIDTSIPPPSKIGSNKEYGPSECPEGGYCSNTQGVLIPKSGYWHQFPQLPVQFCLNMAACDSNRSTILKEIKDCFDSADCTLSCQEYVRELHTCMQHGSEVETCKQLSASYPVKNNHSSSTASSSNAQTDSTTTTSVVNAKMMNGSNSTTSTASDGVPEATCLMCQLPGAGGCSRTKYSDMLCSRGYEGRLCASCVRPHHGASKLLVCIACRHGMSIRWALYALAVACVCGYNFFIIHSSINNALDVTPDTLKTSEAFKAVMSHINQLVVIGNMLLKWPDSMSWLFSHVLHFLQDPASSSSFSLDCLGIDNPAAKLWMRMMFPFFVSCLVASMLLFLREYVFTPMRSRFFPKEVWNLARRCDVLLVAVFVTLQSMYPSLLFTTFYPFACIPVYSITNNNRQLAKRSYWALDMKLQCGERAHLLYGVPIFLLGFFTLCAGLPGYIIWRSVVTSKTSYRRGVTVTIPSGVGATPTFSLTGGGSMSNPEIQARIRYSFLFSPYREGARAWEAYVMLITVFLVIFQTVLKFSGPFLQLLLLCFVTIFNTTLLCTVKPYDSIVLHRISVASLVCILVTCLGVMTMKDTGVFASSVWGQQDGFADSLDFLGQLLVFVSNVLLLGVLTGLVFVLATEDMVSVARGGTRAPGNAGRPRSRIWGRICAVLRAVTDFLFPLVNTALMTLLWVNSVHDQMEGVHSGSGASCASPASSGITGGGSTSTCTACGGSTGGGSTSACTTCGGSTGGGSTSACTTCGGSTGGGSASTCSACGGGTGGGSTSTCTAGGGSTGGGSTRTCTAGGGSTATRLGGGGSTVGSSRATCTANGSSTGGSNIATYAASGSSTVGSSMSGMTGGSLLGRLGGTMVSSTGGSMMDHMGGGMVSSTGGSTMDNTGVSSVNSARGSTMDNMGGSTVNSIRGSTIDDSNRTGWGSTMSSTGGDMMYGTGHGTISSTGGSTMSSGCPYNPSQPPYPYPPPPTAAPYPQPPPPTAAPYPQPPPSTAAPYPQPPPSTATPYPQPPPSTAAPYPQPPPPTAAPYPQPPPSTAAPYPQPPPPTAAPYPQPPPPTAAPYPQPPPSTAAPYPHPPPPPPTADHLQPLIEVPFAATGSHHTSSHHRDPWNSRLEQAKLLAYSSPSLVALSHTAGSSVAGNTSGDLISWGEELSPRLVSDVGVVNTMAAKTSNIAHDTMRVDGADHRPADRVDYRPADVDHRPADADHRPADDIASYRLMGVDHRPAAPAAGSQVPAASSQAPAARSQVPAAGSQASAAGSQAPGAASQAPAGQGPPTYSNYPPPQLITALSGIHFQPLYSPMHSPSSPQQPFPAGTRRLTSQHLTATNTLTPSIPFSSSSPAPSPTIVTPLLSHHSSHSAVDVPEYEENALLDALPHGRQASSYELSRGSSTYPPLF